MKRTSLFLLLAALLMLFSIPLIAIADNFYVETDGSDENDGSSSDPWKTIQWAVDNAENGDIIYIGSGTFAENITVTKAVRIYGEQSGYSEINAENPSDNIFNILWDHVDIRYLIIDGQDAAEIAGVYVGSDIDHFSISYCELNNNEYGIYLTETDNAVMNNNEFNDNKKGIYLSSSDDSDIKYNDFKDNTVGVYLLKSELDIYSNDFKGGNYGIYLKNKDDYYSAADVTQLEGDNGFDEIDKNNVGLGDGDEEDENTGFSCFISTLSF